MPFLSHCNCSHQYDLASNPQCILVSIARIFLSIWSPFLGMWEEWRWWRRWCVLEEPGALWPSKIQVGCGAACQSLLHISSAFGQGREHPEVWIFPGNGAWVMEGHTEMFLLLEECLESRTESPQGAEIPSQTLLVTLQLQSVPASVLKCLIYHFQWVQLKELGAGGCLVLLSELKAAQGGHKPCPGLFCVGMYTALKWILGGKEENQHFLLSASPLLLTGKDSDTLY